MTSTARRPDYASAPLVSLSGTSQRLSDHCLKALGIIFADYALYPIRIKLWDGTIWESAPGQKVHLTITFHRPDGLQCFLVSPSEVALSEGYIFDDYDIIGDLHSAAAVGRFLQERKYSLIDKARLAVLALEIMRTAPSLHRSNTLRSNLSGALHSLRRDRQAIAHHYDVSNEFYRLWLDERMVYSCAYFHNSSDSLGTAQRNKLEYICRKLDLHPGQRFLDIGCGWGALAIYAAKEYGVRATGVTLSERQAAFAKDRIQEEGVSDRCTVRLLDYRNLDPGETFDKIASVGMFEHVGIKQFTAYFHKVWSLLRPGGLFLNHAIAEPPAENAQTGRGLIAAYVFPDGELAPLSVAQNAAEKIGFEVRDVESLREHYAKTLELWVARLEARQEEAVRLVADPTYRLWRLYMAGCSVGFHEGKLQVYQSLYRKPEATTQRRSPFSRASWYRPR